MLDNERRIKRLEQISVGLLLLILLLYALFFGFQCRCVSDVQKGSIDMVQPRAARDLQAEVDKAVEMGMFNVFMNTNVVLENGEAKGNLLIQNVETNAYPVFVEIYEKDTDELLYKSEALEPGYKIEEAKLLHPLEKGTHDCVAYFNVLENDSEEVRNRIGLNVKMTVNE